MHNICRMSKRPIQALIPDLFKQKKRICRPLRDGNNSSGITDRNECTDDVKNGETVDKLESSVAEESACVSVVGASASINPLDSCSHGSESSDSSPEAASKPRSNEAVPEFSSVSEALQFFRNLFPSSKFGGRLPPVILKHQLYAVIRDRAIVDVEVRKLCKSGTVRVLRLGHSTEEDCIVYTKDFMHHSRVYLEEASRGVKSTLEKFLSALCNQLHEATISQEVLVDQLKFSDAEITILINTAGVLAFQDVGSWWLTIPGSIVYLRAFRPGRQAVLQMVKRAKKREILQQDLETRKLPKTCRLGMRYHVYDIVGSDCVTTISTTAGQLLRYAN